MKLYNVTLSFQSSGTLQSVNVLAADAQAAVVEVLSNNDYSANGELYEIRIGQRHALAIPEAVLGR